MEAGAGSGAIGRFAELQGESLNSQQAYNDALKLTGLPVDIQVVDVPLMLAVPMRYRIQDHVIEVNSVLNESRAVRAQQMAEELLHATDHLGNSYTLSAASPLFDMNGGIVMLELLQHYQYRGYFAEFFNYPFHPFHQHFSHDRIKAEVFARLGVLYFAEPELLKCELPQAYEVYHELFGISRYSPHDGTYVRSKIWTTSRRSDQISQRQMEMGGFGAGDRRGFREESASELGRLRQAIAKVLKAPETGKKADL